MRSVLVLAVILGFSSLIAAKDGGRGKGSDDGNSDNDDDGSSSTSSAASSTVTGTTVSGAAAGSNSTSGVTTGTVCEDYMCISGTINGSTTTYVMQSTGKAKLGWMAVGFGQTMANTPMVIMWPNSDGSITVSQRQAPSEVMPTLVSNPPRVATADQSGSDLTGTQPKLAFTIETSGGTSQPIIWAFSDTNPDSSAQDATIVQHLDSGPTTLDMSTSVSSGNTSDPVSDPNAKTGDNSTPMLQYQKMIVAHALLCTIGFLILLPAGALLARYTRTFHNAWFRGHWVFQFAVAGPVITAGIILGIDAVATQPSAQLADTHKKLGLGLWIIYYFQCVLGFVIHRWKPLSWTVDKKRPAQNYGHAVLGLLIVALAFYEVRIGFHHEWDTLSGRPPIGKGADIVWYIWVALIPIAYLAGLVLLPKQFRQERPSMKASQSEYPLQDSDEGRYTDRF
ncbi:CBD9-like protein [Dichomitus squalens]|uniref:CBD9-like protein n=1 Tax=Dichomitus squalens TaxID=114155 RepID=A0A4Q9MCX3_9APHY|nr:CBD9-like protein [Dichomitus squalens]